MNLIPRAASPTTSGSAHSQGTVNLMPHAATPSITRSALSQEGGMELIDLRSPKLKNKNLTQPSTSTQLLATSAEVHVTPIVLPVQNPTPPMPHTMAHVHLTPIVFERGNLN